MSTYNIRRFSKINNSLNLHPTSRKYFLNSCKDKITNNNPTSKDWIDIVKTLKIKDEDDKSRIFHSLLNKHENIVIKIGDSKKIEYEYIISKALSDYDGFVNFYCFFTCEDDYLTVDSTVCKGPGDKMKVIIMPYYELGSFATYKWNDIYQMRSVLKQVFLSIMTAIHKQCFIHGDLHQGNILLEKTEENILIYEIEELGSYIIPTHGIRGLVMDFEESILEAKNQPSFVVSTYIENIYFDFKKLFDFSHKKIRGLVDVKTVEPILSYIGVLLIKEQRPNKSTIEHILDLIDRIELRPID